MNSLIGHESIISFLERTVREGRPAHAYLFTGREGVGKKKVAVRFACMLNCPDLDADPHANCSVCRRMSAQTHPDLLLEKPDKGMIRIERVRSVQGFFRYAPVEGRYRVTIIDDAHTMNRSAQNALLKTLEEPPPSRMLILVTDKPSLLLPTVRSRCRRMRFGPIPTDSLASLLQRQSGLPRERAQVLAAMSGGSVSRALEIGSPAFSGLRQEVVAALSAPAGRGIAGLLEWSAAISSDRARTLQVIEIARTWIRDVLVAKTHYNPSTIMNADMLDRISFAAQHHDEEDLVSVYEELVKASELVEADFNVNKNLATDVLLMRIARILAGPTLGVASD